MWVQHTSPRLVPSLLQHASRLCRGGWIGGWPSKLPPRNPGVCLQVIVPLETAQAFVERCGGEMPSLGRASLQPTVQISPSGFDRAGVESGMSLQISVLLLPAMPYHA